jgi:4-oxalmesaconate hydratase
MGHHVGDEATSRLDRALQRPDLARRRLYPENFVGVCQLPQSPGVPIANSVRELERCVESSASSAAT